VTDFAHLDNPIWNALTTAHRPLARATGLAVRYPSDVSPLSGVREPTPRAFADLRTLVAPEESVGLFTSEALDVPSDWTVVRTRQIDQMVCTEPARSSSIPVVRLGHADVPDMLKLTAATEPGPFLPETIRMGRYFGIRSEDGRLVAMAGERLTLDGFTEISAVCTDPAFRGRGYSKALIVPLVNEMLSQNRVPFLHVKTENTAKAVYERIGFRVRRAIHVTVISPL
jgi:predicted GNAT family acetyltransferase